MAEPLQHEPRQDFVEFEAVVDRHLEMIPRYLDYKLAKIFNTALKSAQVRVSETLGLPVTSVLLTPLLSPNNNIVEGLFGLPDVSWQEFSECRDMDPDLFFPERGASTVAAKEICRRCLVKEDCLEYALTNGEKFGIWGGMTERERRRARRRRALENAIPQVV